MYTLKFAQADHLYHINCFALFTADDCVGGRVYKECGTLCQSTCDNHQSPPFCSSDCTPTCVCPEGQVLRNGQCIETDQCDGKCMPYCNVYCRVGMTINSFTIG